MIELPWSDFKTQILDNPIWKWVYFEINNHYQIYAKQGDFTVLCKIFKDSNADQLAFEVYYKDNVSENLDHNVTTQEEKNDKDLKLASVESSFSENTCVLEIKIPESMAELPMEGRSIAGGYLFTDVYGWNDRLLKIELIDKDFLYAGDLYPATPTEAGIPDVEGLTWAQVKPDGIVLNGFHDTDVPTEKQGWRLWCDDGNQGGTDIYPLGGFGKLVKDTYLQITVEKTATSGATKAAVNLWWGKRKI